MPCTAIPTYRSNRPAGLGLEPRRVMQAVWNRETPSVTVPVQLLSSQMIFLCLVFFSLKIIAPCFAAREKFPTTERVQRNGIGTAGRSAHTPVWPAQARPAWEQAASRTPLLSCRLASSYSFSFHYGCARVTGAPSVTLPFTAASQPFQSLCAHLAW